jgi:hypothetical protein
MNGDDYREEVRAWERERAAKRGRLPLSEKDVFEQLNAVLTEACQTGDIALEMAELNEKFEGGVSAVRAPRRFG